MGTGSTVAGRRVCRCLPALDTAAAAFRGAGAPAPPKGPEQLFEILAPVNDEAAGPFVAQRFRQRPHDHYSETRTSAGSMAAARRPGR